MSLSRGEKAGTRSRQVFLATVLRSMSSSNRNLLFSIAARSTFAKRGCTLAVEGMGSRCKTAMVRLDISEFQRSVVPGMGKFYRAG